MKFERTQFGRQVLIALAIEGLLTAFVFSKDIRLEWDHDGTCETESQNCPISYYNIYLSFSDEFIDKEKRELVGSTPEGRPEERFFQLNVPRDGVARYFAVTAVDEYGKESAYSNSVAIILPQSTRAGRGVEKASVKEGPSPTIRKNVPVLSNAK